MIEVARPAPYVRTQKNSPTETQRPAETGRTSHFATDSELKRRVQLFLAGRNMPGLRRVDVDVTGDTVVLKGRVRTFYEKQLAAHCCRRVAGVIKVIDAMDVA